MEVAILTSSRADFGFYKPLLNLLSKQKGINYNLVVFGTHLSLDYGYTIDNIRASGYGNIIEVKAIPKGDMAIDIVKTIGNTHLIFAEFWEDHNFDLILCLGDRYEMFSAVSASIPFNVPIAHISGGEETLGAIDNVYRHSLSLMSTYHFTNTKSNAERVIEITGSSKNVYNTGSLAVDNIKETKLYTSNEFKDLFNFDLGHPFILCTFHPETVNYKMNSEYALIISDVLTELKYNVLVTMPNADTNGGVIRNELYKTANNSSNIFLFESLGSRGYYTALSRCLLVLGNSSSGIVEAASFSKFAINVGSRQLGREFGLNVIHCKIDREDILKEIENVENLSPLDSNNIYGEGNASNKILEVLKKIDYSK